MTGVPVLVCSKFLNILQVPKELGLLFTYVYNPGDGLIVFCDEPLPCDVAGLTLDTAAGPHMRMKSSPYPIYYISITLSSACDSNQN